MTNKQSFATGTLVGSVATLVTVWACKKFGIVDRAKKAYKTGIEIAKMKANQFKGEDGAKESKDEKPAENA